MITLDCLWAGGRMGEYIEQMPFGGRLKVTRDSWHIEYYFPGPDLRYSGQFKVVPGATLTLISMHFEAPGLSTLNSRKQFQLAVGFPNSAQMVFI
jgi:hypothetical protein